MASNSDVKFGRFAETNGSDHKVWFFIVPVILALIALAGVGIYGISQSSTVKRDIAAVRTKNDELQKTVDERDKLLVAARGDERLLKSAGQAAALFYGVGPEAVESGLLVAQPGDRAAKVLLYGLQPQEGATYTVAARAADGTLKPLRDVAIGPDGTAFVLAKDVPEGTTAIELVVRQADAAPPAQAQGQTPAAEGEKTATAQATPPAEGAQAQGTGASPDAGGGDAPKADEVKPEDRVPQVSLEGATPRIAARFPQEGERGILTQAPGAQARRPAR